MIRPFLVLALAALSYLAAQATELTLFFQLSYLLLSVVLLALLWAGLNLFGWQLQRDTSTHRAAVGDTVRERIDLRNRWWLPRLWLELTDESPLPGRNVGFVAAPGRQSADRWAADTICLQRGRFQFGPTRLTSSDPFGLVRFSRVLPAGGDLVVYPYRESLAALSVPGSTLSGGPLSRRTAFQRSPSVAGVRDYVPGDGLNRIHWRSTARNARLMVKEFEQDPTADVFLVLDLHTRWFVSVESPLTALNSLDRRRTADGALATRLSDVDTAERAVSISASVAETLLNQGLAVGLSCWGREQQIITPDRGPAQFARLLELLAVLEPRSPRSLADVLTAAETRWTSGSTLVIVTAAADVSWLAPLQHLRERGVPALVYLLDGASYGSSADIQPLIDELTALHVPLYVVRHSAPPAAVTPI